METRFGKPFDRNYIDKDHMKNTRSILLASYYQHAERSKYLWSNYNDLFNKHLRNFSHNKKVLLMGNCNVSYNSNRDNKEFKPIIFTISFRQIVKEPTGVTDTSPSLITLFPPTVR